MAKGSLRVNGIIVDTDGEIKASTGDAIVIREDDGSAVITVDTSGNTLINGDTFIGGNTAAETLVAGTPRVQLEGLGYADSSLSIFNNSNDSNGSYLYFGKSRGTALSADTIVQDGDFVGGMEWVAADGTDRASRIAAIYGVVDGTPGANDTPGELIFFTTADGANSGTQRMVIKADGNVGIGTTTPQKHLEISDDGTSGNIPTIRLNSTEPNVGSGDTIGIIDWKSADSGRSGDPVASIKAISSEADGSHTDLLFSTGENADAASERMRITSAGYVGIGASGPWSLLDVRGTGDNTTLTTLTLQNDDYEANQTGQAIRQLFRLNRAGAMRDAAAFIVGKDSDWDDAANTDSHLTISTTLNDTLTEAMRITSAGKVGIGTSTPQGVLAVKVTDFANYSDGVSNTTGQAITIATDYTNGRYTGIYSIYTPADTPAKSKFAHWLTMDTTNGVTANWATTSSFSNGVTRNDLSIKYNGYVGVNAVDPSYQLTVSSNVNSWVGEHHNAATSGNVYGFRIRFSSNPDDNTSKAIEFATTGGDKFQVFSDGDVKNHDNSYGAISDERIKTDIIDANSQWDDVKAVRVRNFKRKDDVEVYGDKAWSQIGVVAQELEKVSPKLIKEQPPSEWEMKNLGFGKKVGGKWVPKQVKGKDMTVKGVSYSILQMKAFKALQEAMAKIETLEAKVKTLEDSG